MSISDYFITIPIWLLMFWYLYILIMGVYRAYLDKRIKGIPLALTSPIIIVGYLVDLISNWTLATVVFLELPKKPLELVTGRLSRHVTETGWRGALSRSICENLLDIFDPTGKHCK